MSAQQYIDSAQERGQQRLENWRAWSRRDSDNVSWPTMSTIRRHYRPEDGNVWDGEPERDVWDAEDAWLIEQAVTALPSLQRDLIIARYLWVRTWGRLEEDFRLPRWRLQSVIRQIEVCMGRA